MKLSPSHNPYNVFFFNIWRQPTSRQPTSTATNLKATNLNQLSQSLDKSSFNQPQDNSGDQMISTFPAMETSFVIPGSFWREQRILHRHPACKQPSGRRSRRVMIGTHLVSMFLLLVRFSSQPQGQQLVSIEIMSAPCTGFAIGSTETDKEGFGHWDGWVVGIFEFGFGVDLWVQ